MHRIYVEDGEVWTLASVYARDRPLPGGGFVVYETEHPPYAQEVCVLTDDGRRLCDIGPEHEHGN